MRIPERHPLTLPAPTEVERASTIDQRVITAGSVAGAAAAPFAVAAGLSSIGAYDHQAVAALIMAAIVVAVASTGRRAATVIAAVSATLWFDFFLTVPFHSFAVHQFDELLTVLALLMVGAMAVVLRTKAERHRDQAEDGRNDLARIHAVNELVAEGRDPVYIVEVVRIELIELLSLRDCSFDRLPLAGDVARIERTGNVVIGDLSWSVHHHGFPGPTVELPVTTLGVAVGRFILEPTPATPVSFDKRIVAVALTDQVAASFALSLT